MLTRDQRTRQAATLQHCTPFFLASCPRAGQGACQWRTPGLAAPFVRGESGVFRGLTWRTSVLQSGMGAGVWLGVYTHPLPLAPVARGAGEGEDVGEDVGARGCDGGETEGGGGGG